MRPCGIPRMFIYVPNTFQHTQEPSGTIRERSGAAQAAPDRMLTMSDYFFRFGQEGYLDLYRDPCVKDQLRKWRSVGGSAMAPNGQTYSDWIVLLRGKYFLRDINIPLNAKHVLLRFRAISSIGP